MHRAFHTARRDVCQHAFYLGFCRRCVDMVFAGQECFDTLTRDIVRLAFVFPLDPTSVLSMPARWKKSVFVGPGWRAVTEIPVSRNS